MTKLGRKTWVIPGGHIPLRSSGKEPECTSRDELCLLNAGGSEAQLEITLYYSDREPVGPYSLVVAPRRLRQIRINDLIDPQAVPLDTPYAAVVQSNVPIVVQFHRLDTSTGNKDWVSLVPYAE